MTLFGWAGLAGTTFAAALLQAVSGFGFAVLAVPLYLLFVDPAKAVQLVIVLSTALSFAVVPGLRRTIAPALLLRLILERCSRRPIPNGKVRIRCNSWNMCETCFLNTKSLSQMWI